MGSWEMRGNQGRCPPFLVAGLLVVCIFAFYNYWSLSGQLYDLVRELDDLQSRLQLCSAKEQDCETRHSKLQLRNRQLEDRMGKIQVEVGQQEEQVRAAQNLAQRKEADVGSLRNDLENVKQESQNCRDEIKTLEAASASKDSQIERLQEENVKLSKNIEKYREELDSMNNKDALHNPAAQQMLSKSKPNGQQNSKLPVLNPGHVANGPLSSVVPKDVQLKSHGTVGIQWHPGSPVLLFDPPDMPRPKASFSVVDPPSAKPPSKTLFNNLEPQAKSDTADAAEEREAQHKDEKKISNVLDKPREDETRNQAGEDDGENDKSNRDQTIKGGQKSKDNTDLLQDEDRHWDQEEPDQNADGTLEEHHQMLKPINGVAKPDPLEQIAENLEADGQETNMQRK